LEKIGKVLSLVLFTSVYAVGCAHTSVAPDAAHPILEKPASSTPTSSSGASSSSAPPIQVTEIKELVVGGVRLPNSRFDIPIAVNPAVEKWVAYFAGRGHPLFERYLERSDYFVPYIQQILRQNNMPEDMVYLALIESGFSNHARSRAAAVGPWQFMSYTGKLYGLTVNWWVDERRDIEKSTMAAIRYLKDLYALFGSWELAAAAYNAGGAKVAHAIRMYHTKDFWQLTKHRYLKSETRNYVPKIMAAAIIDKNRKAFGFQTTYRDDANQPDAVAPDGELVRVEHDANPKDPDDSMSTLLSELDDDDLAEDASGDEAEGASAMAALIAKSESTDKSSPQAKPIATPHVNKKGELGKERLVEFELQSPADLLNVARAASLSYQTVKSLNPEILRWCTPPNTKSYRVKLPESSKDKFIEAYNHPTFPRSVRFRSYKVRRGDNLKKIAHRFGIKEDPIVDLNVQRSIASAHSNLKTGSEILLPIPTDHSRSIASLDLYDPPEKHRRRRHRRSGYKKPYRISLKDRKAAREDPGARGKI
jgi:hypothetical protein